MEKPRLKAVGYRRVSMREQVDGHSLDAQEKNIRDYAASQGWDLIEIYTDAGISAKKDSHRPDLERLMGDAEAKKFDVIVVDKIDRFYRHLAGLLTALDQLRSMDISFASVQERLDFTSPWGKLMLTVLGILAEIYLDNLRQETLKGKHQRAREGLWNGLPPYGYCKGLCSACEDPNGKGYCPDFGKPNKSDGKRLVLHPVDSEVVKLVYSWYLSGKQSDAGIAEKLNSYQMTFPDGFTVQVRQKGHPGVSVAGPFKKDLIRDMLNRVFYTGKLPYKASSEIGARKTKRSELDEMTLYEGKHPALISEEDFQQVQEMRVTLGSNWRAEKPTAQLYPLTGILRCGYCGAAMRGVSSSSRRYYRDASRIERSTNCQQDTVRAEVVERQIADILLDILKDWTADQGLERSNALVLEAEGRYERAKELYLLGQLNRDDFKKESERYEHIQSTLSYSNPNAIITLVNSIRPALEDWDRTLPIERKKLLRMAVQAAFLRGNVIVAVQLTDSFMPLVTQKSCSSGEGGADSRVRLADLRVKGIAQQRVRLFYNRARALIPYREQISSLYTYGYGLFRPYLLALAARLVRRSLLDSEDDIFYLHWEEIRSAVNGAGEESLRELVRSRRSEIERVRGIELPEVIYGDEPPPVLPSSAERMSGTPTSRGYYTGTVKIVHSLGDFQKLEAGDVLVVPYSDVGWTPLFVKAGAVIAASGGMLSHSSVVAREYGIPAVVSVANAMQLKDGQRVCVDGYRGWVTIIESA